MKTYTILLKKSVEKELDNLPLKIFDRIILKIESLKKNPRSKDSKKLKGREGYRVRVGNYGILYLIDGRKRSIEIYSVAHRKEVYR